MRQAAAELNSNPSPKRRRDVRAEESHFFPVKYPRSPKDEVGGIVYFGRMIDKIRLMKAGELHPDLHANLGTGFDSRCVNFLGIIYEPLKKYVEEGATDSEALAWCFENGSNPSEEQIEVWNDFMRKRGWNDDVTATLIRRKKESGFEARDDIQTMFQYIDADEGRN
jgi:gluconokinase